MVNHLDKSLFEFTVSKQDCYFSTWTQSDPPCNRSVWAGFVTSHFQAVFTGIYSHIRSSL